MPTANTTGRCLGYRLKFTQRPTKFTEGNERRAFSVSASPRLLKLGVFSSRQQSLSSPRMCKFRRKNFSACPWSSFPSFTGISPQKVACGISFHVRGQKRTTRLLTGLEAQIWLVSLESGISTSACLTTVSVASALKSAQTSKNRLTCQVSAARLRCLSDCPLSSIGRAADS